MEKFPPLEGTFPSSLENTMAIPKFKTKKDILDYALNGTEPLVQQIVRYKIEQSGASLNVGEVNNYIKKEMISFKNDYDDWLDCNGV